MDEQPKVTNDDHLVIMCTDFRGLDVAMAALARLPADFPSPIVFSAPIDFRRANNIAAEHKIALPFVGVAGDTELAAGKIFLVSPDKELALGDRRIDFKNTSAEHVSIERSLANGATAYGDRLIAVIVSDTGDAAAGAVEVRRRHGTVVVLDHRKKGSLASTVIPPTAVDQVTSLDSIAGVLSDMVRDAPFPESQEDEQAFARILDITTQHATIDFKRYKRAPLLRRISRRMAAKRIQKLSDYAEHVASDGTEAGELVMSFLIRVTEFFRDPEAYAFLKTSILPTLIEKARSGDRMIRVWSVGCATGEEPYSIAMLFADLLGEELSSWSIKIFATDVDGEAVEFARRGYFPRNVLENVPWDYRSRFFEKSGESQAVVKKLRQMVIFGQQDLSRSAPFPRIDLIICRNVLIYFKTDVQQQVLDTFAYSLSRTSGYLFLGKAETARPSKARFDILNKNWKVYHCTRGPMVATARSNVIRANTYTNEARSQIRRVELSSVLEKELTVGAIESGASRRFSEYVLRHIPVGIVILDRTYRIISINPAARRLLGIHEVIHELDFLHAAKGIPYTDVRAAIDTVFRERAPLSLPQVVLETKASRELRYISMTFAPIAAENPASDLLTICIQDVTETIGAKRTAEQVQAQHRAVLEELEAANKRLSELNRELQDTNEELQGANEEMALAQEELQATNEELEATNEELQATNEELETHNEEIQATNEEIQATNEELVSRGHELQKLTELLETQRTRLAEMVELAPFYILVLRGPSFIVEAHNPRFSALFREQNAKGRPLVEVFPGFEDTELVTALLQAYRTDRPETSAVKIDAGDAPRLKCSIVPLHDHAGRVDGLVVYGNEVDEARSTPTS